jgi:hypothetical protein
MVILGSSLRTDALGMYLRTRSRTVMRSNLVRSRLEKLRHLQAWIYTMTMHQVLGATSLLVAVSWRSLQPERVLLWHRILLTLGRCFCTSLLRLRVAVRQVSTRCWERS